MNPFVQGIQTWRNIVRNALNISCQVTLPALLFAILTTVRKIIEYQLQQICGGTITVLPAKTHSHKIGTRYPVLVSSSILNNWQGMRSMAIREMIFI